MSSGVSEVDEMGAIGEEGGRWKGRGDFMPELEKGGDDSAGGRRGEESNFIGGRVSECKKSRKSGGKCRVQKSRRRRCLISEAT